MLENEIPYIPFMDQKEFKKYAKLWTHLGELTTGIQKLLRIRENKRSPAIIAPIEMHRHTAERFLKDIILKIDSILKHYRGGCQCPQWL